MIAEDRALLLDHDSGTLLAMQGELRNAGFSVITTAEAEEAWSDFISHEPALVVVKLCPARPATVRLIRRIRGEASSWVPVIVVTSERGSEVQRSVFAAGQQAATRLLQLPHDLDQLGVVAREATRLDVHHLRERRQKLLYHDLLRALQECDGVIARVAERMGEDRTTIYYHLKKFGLY